MPSKPIPSLIFTDADGLAENTEHAVLVLDISQKEIKSGNVASTLERLMVIADNKESVYRYRESLLFQVSGYETDRRELPEIPEVRRFFSLLVKEWPHWLWFLQRGVGAIPLLLALLCRVKVIRGSGGSYGTEFEDDDEWQRCLLDLFDRGNALFDAFDIPQSDVEASAESAIAEITGG
jgi:hypothetical protein